MDAEALKIFQEAPHVRLGSCPTARNAAFSASPSPSGSVIASIASLSTCLLPTEKGKRCDACHTLPRNGLSLRRCSGCASFWYCGTVCQNHAWRAHHKKLCKPFNAFAVSTTYQALSAHDQVDAQLLSQMVADPLSWNLSVRHNNLDEPHEAFLDLLKGPRGEDFELPFCLPKGTAAAEAFHLAKELYSRFGNNNFVLHSHLNAYAHGVFPLASRLFNHSCVPNAACKYVIKPSEPVTMQIVALQDIAPGEEITIPYLDPALPYQIRREALDANYGFACKCRLCVFERGIEPVDPPPERGSSALRDLEASLRAFSLGSDIQTLRVPKTPGAFESMSAALRLVFHESYLPGLSELFSKTSHEGPYLDAVESGLTLLALYVLVYPPNYPQTGMHALELTKTIWNLICTAGADLPARETDVLEAQVQRFLAISADILENFGPEGDGGGPWEEIETLKDALSV
ncbi:SET domain-containing protein [Trametes meyenii]|nr:SET domain-containing protein [Trametes meyenii]